MSFSSVLPPPSAPRLPSRRQAPESSSSTRTAQPHRDLLHHRVRFRMHARHIENIFTAANPPESRRLAQERLRPHSRHRRQTGPVTETARSHCEIQRSSRAVRFRNPRHAYPQQRFSSLRCSNPATQFTQLSSHRLQRFVPTASPVHFCADTDPRQSILGRASLAPPADPCKRRASAKSLQATASGREVRKLLQSNIRRRINLTRTRFRSTTTLSRSVRPSAFRKSRTSDSVSRDAVPIPDRDRLHAEFRHQRLQRASSRPSSSVFGLERINHVVRQELPRLIHHRDFLRLP